MKGILTSIFTVLTINTLHAQPQPEAPKIVITVTIDQLRTDYVENFSPLYGERGFKRLWKDGRVYQNASFSFDNVDRSSAVASIYTGATPSLHGIIANRWMDPTTLRPISSVDDPSYLGNYTDESSSPVAMLTSTITDELKIATRNKGLVYAIAPYRDAAILSAGHSADGAYWINTINGKWCGTTYYSDFPWWLNRINEREGLDMRISGMTWSPSYSTDKYQYLPEWRDIPFKYKLDDDRNNRFRRFLTTPFVNDEVNRLAGQLLENTNLGKDNITDILALTYYAGNYMNKSTQECAMELQDVYVRLDLAIAELIEMVDKSVGLNNALFCITSTGYVDSDATDLGIYRIPDGTFHLNRCAGLLNMYLMAIYGEGKYVDAYYNQQLYLNHKLIEKKEINAKELEEKATEFLMQFSGVNEAYSEHQILLGSWRPNTELIRNGYHRKRSGDLLIYCQPGWKVVDDNHPLQNKIVRDGYVPMPIIFFGNHIEAEKIATPITVDHIAPTLARTLRISAPHAAKSKPINNLLK